MKKVALLLIITSCIVLVLACKGLLKDTAPMQTSPPDVLPLFVITHVTCPGIPPTSQACTAVNPDETQLRPQQFNGIVKTIFNIYQNQISSK